MLTPEERIELKNKADILLEASEYESSECGEWWKVISECMNNVIDYDHIFNEEIVKQIVQEFNETYELFLDECEFVEEVVTIKRKVKTLKWKYED